jgi:predicted GH43/DUF377 family glycosyl hydrolase
MKDNPMGCKAGQDVIRRCEGNPLVTLESLPFRASDIWNAGVVRVGDEVLLLLTIETLVGQYTIYRAHSNDGLNFTVEGEPFLEPVESGPQEMYENGGIRDPRITPIDGEFYITYIADGHHGLRLGLARTTDFQSVERLAYISQVDVRAGALFSRTIGGRHAVLKRPDAGCSIWLSTSADLEFWGNESVVMTPRGGYWDSNRIGAAAPPIEIDAGWLLIYYGEKLTSAGPLVRLGAAMLDRDDPSHVIGRSNIPILSPRERYERVGDVPNVVFSCGALIEGDDVVVYYGASDSCICRGSAPLGDILRLCFEGEKLTQMAEHDELAEEADEEKGQD